MNTICGLCETELAEREPDRAVTSGICAACLARLAGAACDKMLLETLDAPVLLMQGNPRQVVAANAKALQLFAKQPSEVEAYRGGEVFDCVHSFTDAGCGKNINCEHCAIKAAIVDTFATATSHRSVATTLPVKKAGLLERRALQVSTEKVGDLALVRIERYDNA